MAEPTLCPECSMWFVKVCLRCIQRKLERVQLANRKPKPLRG